MFFKKNPKYVLEKILHTNNSQEQLKSVDQSTNDISNLKLFASIKKSPKAAIKNINVLTPVENNIKVNSHSKKSLSCLNFKKLLQSTQSRSILSKDGEIKLKKDFLDEELFLKSLLLKELKRETIVENYENNILPKRDKFYLTSIDHGLEKNYSFLQKILLPPLDLKKLNIDVYCDMDKPDENKFNNNIKLMSEIDYIRKILIDNLGKYQNSKEKKIELKKCRSVINFSNIESKSFVDSKSFVEKIKFIKFNNSSLNELKRTPFYNQRIINSPINKETEKNLDMTITERIVREKKNFRIDFNFKIQNIKDPLDENEILNNPNKLKTVQIENCRMIRNRYKNNSEKKNFIAIEKSPKIELLEEINKPIDERKIREEKLREKKLKDKKKLEEKILNKEKRRNEKQKLKEEKKLLDEKKFKEEQKLREEKRIKDAQKLFEDQKLKEEKRQRMKKLNKNENKKLSEENHHHSPSNFIKIDDFHPKINKNWYIKEFGNEFTDLRPWD